jgi:alcohol dehydrogenase
MNTFDFYSPIRIRFGKGISLQVGPEAAAAGLQHVLVITDDGVFQAGLVQPILSSIAEAGIQSVVYKDVTSNPTEGNVAEAADLARAEGCQAVIAVGGGSPIDTAKGAAIVAACGGKIADYTGWDAIRGAPLPIFALPTTAGTGSEVTNWAVISQQEDHQKYLIGSPKIAPVLALLDPGLTFSLPPALTAYTGIDALVHAIEAYISTLHNPVSDALALTAIEMIGRSLLKVLDAPADEQARSEMLLASSMAGMAFNNADLGAVHCMSEALGGMYDMHHGLANAICLVTIMEFNASVAANRYTAIATALGNLGGDGVESVKALIDSIGIPSLRECGVNEADLPELAHIAMQNISVAGNPREVSEDDFGELFHSIMH